MNFNRQRAVSPIIATLLLIAIAVAAGIIVYVYVNSLAGGLTGSGGSQVSDIVQMQSYDFTGRGVSGNPQTLVMALKNSGGSSVTISAVYFDGTALTQYSNNVTIGYTTYYQGVLHNNCGEAGRAVCHIDIASTSWLAAPITNAIALNSTDIILTDTAPHSGLITTTLATTGDAQLVLTLGAGQTPGTTHLIKIITSTGGQSVISVVAGGHG